MMNRRNFLTLAAAALPAACESPKRTSLPASPPAPRKKGLCIATNKRTPEEVEAMLAAVGARWLYNWNLKPPETLPPGVDYIPMVFSGRWGVDKSVERLKPLIASNGYKELLGFNEPEHEKQGNTAVEKALDEWPKLEALGVRLGSPACVHPDNEWMTTFMKGAEERGLRIDFVCMHSYIGPNADSMVKRIEETHERYGRPVWITEFAAGDWNAPSPQENRHKPERIAAYVAELLPRLEGMDIVERYNWFNAGIDSRPLGTSSLFNPDGSLTIVGEAYRSVG